MKHGKSNMTMIGVKTRQNDRQRDKMTDTQNRQKQHRKETKYIAFMQGNTVQQKGKGWD